MKKNTTKYKTGAIRDNRIGKEDYTESLSWLALKRYAKYMSKKAEVYGRGNWQKGIEPNDYIDSMVRHLQKFLSEWQYGVCEEHDDHLSAMMFNLQGLMHELELIKFDKGRFEMSDNYKEIYEK